MASSFMMNVNDNFNLQAFCEKLADTYRGKGFNMNMAMFNANTAQVVFDKGVGGINMLLGLGQGIKVNFTVNNGTLMANFTEAEWTGKIIGLAVGWILCLIPLITAIIGCVKQSSLPKEIQNDATMIISGM